MPPSDASRQAVVRQWLDKAESDLGAARYLLGGGAAYSATVAFHCQQAVEKALKAYLSAQEAPFPKTHDLDLLLERMAVISPDLAQNLDECSRLTPFGVEIRYPGDFPEISQEEARQAVELAEHAFFSVSEALGKAP